MVMASASFRACSRLALSQVRVRAAGEVWPEARTSSCWVPSTLLSRLSPSARVVGMVLATRPSWDWAARVALVPTTA